MPKNQKGVLIINLINGAITYIVLMFSTVLAWFTLGRYIVQIIAIIGTAAPNAEATAVAQQAVISVNLLFILFVVIWTLWFAYVVHSNEFEVSYNQKKW